ncbi:hypothetical protein CHS0354_012242 [Potamilus streckersoni]|uniref:Rho GTPase-activating protein 21 n=1 Tax=Potamilus streckersoni TaxID=2493646 RepID=A0AAE0SAD7_9BIVA|nr:hypothetical protein CHS0354_012242 [Potamilus streckersoni]
MESKLDRGGHQGQGSGQRSTGASGLRKVNIKRDEHLGYGFTLRHFIVYPPESSQDQRSTKDIDYSSDENEFEDNYLHRSKLSSWEPMDTIFVKNVRTDGPARIAGLNPGDRILSVNGEPVSGKSYAQVISLIQQSSGDLELLVVPKDEDILQLAYQKSGQSFDSQLSLSSSDSSSSRGHSGHVIKVHPQFQHGYTTLSSDSPAQNTAIKVDTSRYRYVPSPSLDISHSSYSGNWGEKIISMSANSLEGRNPDSMEVRLSDRERDRSACTLKSSTSYTSGLSVYREPPYKTKDESISKNVFLDRKREFESRATQENVNPQNRTYSFGLYFPVQRNRGSASAENVSRSTVLIRQSRENVLQSNDSQENIAKQGRTVPVEYRYSGDSNGWEKVRSQESLLQESDDSCVQSNSVRHSLPDSGVQIWTSQSRHLSEASSPENTSLPDSSRKDIYSTRQYVPVISQTPVSRNPKMSASVDSIDPHSNIYQAEQQYRSSVSRVPDQNLQPRTFVVKFSENSKDGGCRSSPVPTSQSYGAAFALTKSPTTTQIEIRQKEREPRILVSHRKQQFEKGETLMTQTPSNINRYKTEIEKITTRGKFDGVAARLASFEKQSSTESRSRSNTPVSSSSSSGTRSRRVSMERLKSPEPSQNSQSQISQSQYQDSTPIRIYVSQGNSSSSGTPVVEIVSDSRPRETPKLMSRQSTDVESDGFSDQVDSEHLGNKPVRKASFLSAVNAPYGRYLPSSGYETSSETPTPTPPTSAWSGSSGSLASGASSNFHYSPSTAVSTVITSSPPNEGLSVTDSSISTTPDQDTISTVRFRKKEEMSPDDLETKLHRRTSYLMATAKDRSVINMTMTSPQSAPDLQTPVIQKQVSMRKLKYFFGEKTPKIIEATEKMEPASPLQEVLKEGTLHCKTDMIDGRRASDRSWKPVWAMLRGHCLYVAKDKKESSGSIFIYDEQPISIKSSIVDIAHSYTKKKNVFRLKTYNGSEYLFQADDHDTMLSWIDAIKRNNNPDSDDSGITSAELIIRKTLECEQSTQVKISPPPAIKMSKKLSVLSMKPKMPQSPSMKRRKTSSEKDESKAKTWKGKFKSIRKLGSGQSTCVQPEKTGMFGVPLEYCTPSPNNEYVPLIVDLCIQIVEAKGLEMTGVYRIPGNKAAVTTIQEEVNKGVDKMNLDHEKWSDVNVISSLLKSFFRTLPEPLIPDELYQSFIDANRMQDTERRMLKIKRLLHELPEHNFETFRILAKHLNKVAQYGDVNKMEAKNLAIVFGPTLIHKTDDSVMTLMTDMSDRCKIIESIILHSDWFFSSWDVDNYVPTDDDATECTSIMSGSTREDPDHPAINPKEIIVSIVEAANRKLRGEHVEKGNTDHRGASPTYSERNIDQEVKLRSLKLTQSDTTSHSSPNLSSMQRSAEITKPPLMPSIAERMTKSQEFSDREFADWDFIDAEKENQGVYIKPFSRHFSEDTMFDKNDELEISHGHPSVPLSRETLESLRRIELEARALREREEKRRLEHEKRRLEKQRIEQDILRTQQEIEIDERHSVDDLLSAPDSLSWSTPEYYNRPTDGSYRDSSGHMTRDSSGHVTRDSWISQSKYTNHIPHSADSVPGGKYFVSVGNSKGGNNDRNGRQPKQASVESLIATSKRTGSLENMIDTRQSGPGRPRGNVRGSRKRDEKSGKRESSEVIRLPNGSLIRNSSRRRGSLDSLIDSIEKRDSRMSWASTDSEEGFDLLTTLTSTFDQKLQNFSKTQSQGSSHQQCHGSTTGSYNALNEVTDESVQNRLPPQVPLTQVNRNSAGYLIGGSNDAKKQFRDPSLHRTPVKPEAKIGYATRFERGTNSSYLTQVHSDSSLLGHGYSTYLVSDLTYPSDIFSQTESRVSSVMVPTPTPPIMLADSSFHGSNFSMKPSALQGGANKWEVRSPSVQTDVRPISKSEKTELNQSVKLLGNGDRNKTCNRMTSKLSGSDRDLCYIKSRSTSPPPSAKRAPHERRKKRRHTVGGIDDAEHMKAITSVIGQKDELRKSAWEQLQPVVQNSGLGPNSSLQTWLRQERHRLSFPDVSSITDPVDRSSNKKN